jgi:hypothetical protein
MLPHAGAQAVQVDADGQVAKHLRASCIGPIVAIAQTMSNDSNIATPQQVQLH